MEKEIWKPIPDFEGYEVSDLGRVRSYWVKGSKSRIALKPQRNMSPSRNGRYRSVALVKDKIRYQRRLSQLVLEAFVGPRREGTEVCHNNCDSKDDRLDNLRYDSHRNNLRDGNGSHASRLTNREAFQLRQLAAQGISDRELAEQFNISLYSVARCRCGKTYKYVQGLLTKYTCKAKGHKRLSDNEVIEMRKLANEQDASQADLADRFQVSQSAVSLIVRGLRRKDGCK